MNFFLVFLGGGLGSLARFGLGLWLAPINSRFPWATLVANGLACLILGILTGLNLRQHFPPQYRLLMATGFCGGFSTFSTFTSETWSLWNQAQNEIALLNVLGSFTLCFTCLLLGIKLTGFLT